MQADPNAESAANAGDRARQDFLASVKVRSVADRMPESRGPDAPGAEMESVDKAKGRGRKSPSEKRKILVLQISKAVLKKSCIEAAEFQPVDELLMQHGRVRVKQPPFGKCYFESLLWHLKREYKDALFQIEFDTVEALAQATAEELQVNWDYYTAYMSTEYMQLNIHKDTAAIKETCRQIARFVWNIPVADAMVMAGGCVVQRIQRIWTDGGYYDVVWRDMPKRTEKTAVVYDLVNIGSHYDTGASIEEYKVIGVENLVANFRALNIAIDPEEVRLVLAQVADQNRGCPEAKGNAKMFSVSMKNGTQRIVPWAVLVKTQRTKAMVRDIARFAHVKSIAECRYDKDLWPFYLCSFNFPLNADGHPMGQLYVDRRFLAREEVAEKVVRLFEEKNPRPRTLVPTPDTVDDTLWLRRFKWRGHNRHLPEFIEGVDDARTAEDDALFETDTSPLVRTPHPQPVTAPNSGISDTESDEAREARRAAFWQPLEPASHPAPVPNLANSGISDMPSEDNAAREARLAQERILQLQHEVQMKETEAEELRLAAEESARLMEIGQGAQLALVERCEALAGAGDSAELQALVETAEQKQDLLDASVKVAMYRQQLADEAAINAQKETLELAESRAYAARLAQQITDAESERLAIEIETARKKQQNEAAQRELQMLEQTPVHDPAHPPQTDTETPPRAQRVSTRQREASHSAAKDAPAPIVPKSYRSCADCTALATPDKPTIKCCKEDCDHWIHTSCGIEQVTIGTFLCTACFTADFAKVMEDPQDGASLGDGQASQKQTFKEKSKYRYTGELSTPNSNAAWFRMLTYRHLTVESGTYSSSTGYTLEAFGFFEARSKTFNVALVSRPGRGALPRSPSYTVTNISWLGLDTEGNSLTLPKPGRSSYYFCFIITMYVLSKIFRTMPPSVMDALNRVHSAPKKSEKPVLAMAPAGAAKADTALDGAGSKKKKTTADKATDDTEGKLNESDELSAKNKKLEQELKEMRALLAAAEQNKRDYSDSEQGSTRDPRDRRNKKQRSESDTDEKRGTLHRADVYRAMSVSVETGTHAAMSPGATEILKFAVVTHLNDYDYLSYNFVEGYDIRRARPCRATSRDILAIRESKNR